MARDRANINTGIWTDDDWRALTRDQQWLYELLLTHPELSYAGVCDWRPGRLAQFAAGTTKGEVESIGAQLQSRRFILIDEDTEEVLIRSFLRHDGLLKQPKLTVSMVNAYGAVASKSLREVVIHELKRLHSESPDLNAFRNEKALALLKLSSSPIEAFTQGFTPAVTPGFTPNGEQAQALPTSTATTTATPTEVGGSGGRRKPERPLPDSWTPNSAHNSYATENGINVDFQAERFRNHAQANDRRARDWDAAFRNWLLKADKSPTTSKNPLWDA